MDVLVTHEKIVSFFGLHISSRNRCRILSSRVGASYFSRQDRQLSLSSQSIIDCMCLRGSALGTVAR
jgi:hypothetical protein